MLVEASCLLLFWSCIIANENPDPLDRAEHVKRTPLKNSDSCFQHDSTTERLTTVYEDIVNIYYSDFSFSTGYFGDEVSKKICIIYVVIVILSSAFLAWLGFDITTIIIANEIFLFILVLLSLTPRIHLLYMPPYYE
jgi:hypothetical protein